VCCSVLQRAHPYGEAHVHTKSGRSIQRVAENSTVFRLAEVCFNVLQCVAVFCGVLQYFVMCCSILWRAHSYREARLHTETCSILQCAEACCRVSQRAAEWCSILWRAHPYRETRVHTGSCRGAQYTAVCCSVLSCDAVQASMQTRPYR